MPKKNAISQARRLDEERANNKLRGPLHDIPIIIKDSIATSMELGMPTTAGAFAFSGSYAKENATVAERLLRQGLIIIGKASMTELCGAKSGGTMGAWSSVNGQTQSPYIEGGTRNFNPARRSFPGGSSGGSAVGVSAGFAPVSLGTETGGSICMPANCAGLYSIKATWNTVPLTGVLTLSRDHDSIGPMAKCPQDIALLMNLLNPSIAADVDHKE